jgi:hypothetical protein
VIEEMYADGIRREAFDHGSDEFASAVSNIEQQFGPQPSSMWKSISTPHYNSIYDDQIVSTVNMIRPTYLDDLKPFATGRKFFLNKGWVYDKVYLFTHVGDCTLPRPQGSNPLCIGGLLNIYGQPGDEDLTQYKCLYFSCADHSAVEEWASKSLPQGAYQTFYSATFDTADDNRVLRMKSYVYSEPGPFTDWNVVWEWTAASRGIVSN